MKLKEGFVLRDIAGEFVVVPLSDTMDDMKCIITLNDTGAFLWQQLESEKSEAELTQALLDEYDVEAARAENAVHSFIQKISEIGCLAE